VDADVLNVGSSAALVDPVLEKLAIADWTGSRDKFDFQAYVLSPPANTKGSLAESWSQPDPLTLIIKVRQGVHWHKKSPMNGRALTAQDIEYNYHRILGLGSGFTEPSEATTVGFKWPGVKLESVTATDESTVVFKLQEPSLTFLDAILNERSGFIYPPEVIKEHGDARDWRNLVGTGPMMLTEWVEGSSITWEKNPDYWGYDEKYPQNRLPYVDEIRGLIMPEVATYLAALRSGKLDYVGQGLGKISTIDQAESLQRTNPEIKMWPLLSVALTPTGLNVSKPPFNDIRVRKAMQMALDLETVNNTLFGGLGDTTPYGIIGQARLGYYIPFEEWPEEIKDNYAYDPERAKQLLAEAGYPNGFKTKYEFSSENPAWTNLDYSQLAVAYWAEIGVDVEIDILDRTASWF
jgi:peptide/nickel transport system substrate-binding protein